MPGSVANAVAVATLPQTLAIAFQRSQTYELQLNEYANGETQRKVLAATSRKSWRIVRRVVAAKMTELRDFYLARGGGLEAFYFYDPWETSPLFTLTPSGTQGRYTVVFRGEWSQEMGMGRGEAGIELVEVA